MTSQVYFIRSADGLVKIGTSSDVSKRLKALSTAHGANLELLGSVPGGHEIERAFHVRWAECRVNREWFRPSDDMLVAIEREIAGPKLPLAFPKPRKGEETERAMDGLISFFRQLYPDDTATRISDDTGIPADTIRKWLSRSGLPSGTTAAGLIYIYGPRFLLATWPEKTAPAWLHESIAFVDAEAAIEQIASAVSAFADALPKTAETSRRGLLERFSAAVGSVLPSLSEPRP